MDGFSFSIQTEISKRNKDYGVRNTRLKNIFIKKGIVLFMYSGRGCGQNENVSYKLSFPFLEQPFNYYQAFNLYKNIEIRERIKRTLNRLEELMQLQDNWDGYGALKIEREAYENTKEALVVIAKKTSEPWNLFPNTNGTLLLTAPDRKKASINIGNNEFSFFAMGENKSSVQGMEKFSTENLSTVFGEILTVIGNG